MSLPRSLATVGACTLGVVFAGCAPHAAPEAAAAGVQTQAFISQECATSLAVAQRYETDLSRLTSQGTVTFGGQRVKVAGADAEYAYTRPDAATWTLWWRSMSWLAALVDQDRAHEAVDLAVDWHRALPDPGSAGGNKAVVSVGWNEGAVTQRMRTMLCLWVATRDDRLQEVITDLAEANLDSARYYGRPQRAPHNHGAMSNFALVRAGELLNRPDWIAAGLDRFAADFPEVFAPCGADFEQSAPYLDHNISLWTRAERTARSYGRDSLAADISRALAAARLGLASLTTPAGVVPAIGDGSPLEGPVPQTGTPRHWWCADAGWAAGRDSWSEPTYHYTLRFGPSPRGHGHDDHGSLTWWVSKAGGVDVLTDRGNPPKDTAPALKEWAESRAAHNTFWSSDVRTPRATTATRRLGPSGPEFTIRDRKTVHATVRTRSISVSSDKLVVTDRADSRLSGDPIWHQTWHLAPAWQPYPGSESGVVAEHPSGARLMLTCLGTGDSATARRESIAPERSWTAHYPDGQRALTLTCSTRGSQPVIRSALQVLDRG